MIVASGFRMFLNNGSSGSESFGRYPLSCHLKKKTTCISQGMQYVGNLHDIGSAHIRILIGKDISLLSSRGGISFVCDLKSQHTN